MTNYTVKWSSRDFGVWADERAVEFVLKPRKALPYTVRGRRMRIMGPEDWGWHRMAYPVIKPLAVQQAYVNINKRMRLAGYTK